ncbi:MAG: glycosyltransferase [Elusimicrobia bacterium]|nr:glycosyltransferase [Elusimicrobiota bacterium]
MKRVLFVATSTTQGGAEKTVYTLATLLDPQKFQVAGIVSLKPKGVFAEKLESMGHKVYTLGLTGRPNLGHLKALGDIVRETKPDLVHAVMFQAIQFSRAMRLFGYAEFPLLSAPRVHYRTRSNFSLWIDRLLKPFDAMLATESEASRKYLLEKLKYDPDKVVTVYNGTDIASWPLSKVDRERVRGKLGLGPEHVLIGAVGRLDEQKGHRFLLEAVAQLKAAHKVKLAVVGEGPLRGELEALARSLHLEHDVVFPGELQNIPVWLSAFDIFVQPSLWEGLPNALLEAMGMGLPVIATKVDGVPELVQHDVNGLLVEAGQPQGLFMAIQDLALDAAFRGRLASAAKRTIQEKFKLADMIANYEKLYAKLTAVGSRPPNFPKPEGTYGIP